MLLRQGQHSVQAWILGLIETRLNLLMLLSSVQHALVPCNVQGIFRVLGIRTYSTQGVGRRQMYLHI